MSPSRPDDVLLACATESDCSHGEIPIAALKLFYRVLALAFQIPIVGSECGIAISKSRF